MLGSGCWIIDLECWICDFECWIFEFPSLHFRVCIATFGFCFFICTCLILDFELCSDVVSWIMDCSFWECGIWILEFELWIYSRLWIVILDFELWILYVLLLVLNCGVWISDYACWRFNFECWILIVGCCMLAKYMCSERLSLLI